jgi:Putative transposase
MPTLFGVLPAVSRSAMADNWVNSLSHEDLLQELKTITVAVKVLLTSGGLRLSLDEFLRRFLLPILPKGFVRIRNSGFLANRKRAKLLPLCFPLLGATPQPQAEAPASGTQGSPSWRCPQCGGPMRVLERFTAAELQLRSPPTVAAAA